MPKHKNSLALVFSAMLNQKVFVIEQPADGFVISYFTVPNKKRMVASQFKKK
jgi:hypothetical protein